jgi:integrase
VALTDYPLKSISLFDGGGLYLLITPSGGKLWRFKYRFNKKEKKLAFGSYPEISLQDARKKREEARRLLANNVDPDAVRKAQKQAITKEIDTFEAVAHEWHIAFTPSWTARHGATIMSRLNHDLIPWSGSRPINEIKAPELLSVLRRAESRGALELAHRLRAIAGQVFRYAVATGKAERDSSGDLRGAIPPPKVKHHAAITDPKEAALLLRTLDGHQGGFVIRCALRLFVRPGELRHAEWTEINLEEAVWNIPAHKMKMKQAHIVPLCNQAIKISKELQAYNGAGHYVFPSVRTHTRPMSENTVNAALRNAGYDKNTMTGHGFRAMARTILDEVLHVRPDYIEHQLAHAVRDQNGRAYNRTAHLEEHRKMMQKWADYLDGLKAGAVVAPWWCRSKRQRDSRRPFWQ